jgi:hypothetical protein
MLEKFQSMEAILKDLSRRGESVEVPRWHKELLDNRESLLRQGIAKVLDWEEAKGEIMEATSCRRDPSWIRDHLKDA